MKHCEKCGFDPRFRETNKAHFEKKKADLSAKYDALIEKQAARIDFLERRNKALFYRIKPLNMDMIKKGES